MGEELATVQPSSIVPNAQNLRILATDMFNSQMFRGVSSPAQAVAIIQMGAELGFGPVTALNIIKIIQGQMTVAARGLLALAQNKAGVSWKVVESTDKRCAILFSRPKWGDMEISFTLDEAKAAGLLRAGGGWDKYPQDMLFARCASRGVRRIAPDAISGLYSTEEMQDAVPFTGGSTVQGSAADEGRGQGCQTVVDAEEVHSPAPPSPAPSGLSKYHLLKEIGAEKARSGRTLSTPCSRTGTSATPTKYRPNDVARLFEILRNMGDTDEADEAGDGN